MTPIQSIAPVVKTFCRLIAAYTLPLIGSEHPPKPGDRVITVSSYLIITLSLLSPPGTAMAGCQASGLADTLYVSHNANSYLVFDHDIQLADIGGVVDSTHTQADYVAQLEGNVLIFRAVHRHAQPTSLLVKTGDRILVAPVSYRAQPTHLLYDFRQAAATEAIGGHPPSRQQYRQQQRSRLKGMAGASSTIKKAKKDRMTWTLTGVKADHATIYLGLKAKNASSIRYHPEHIAFEHQLHYRGRFLGKKKMISRPVTPILITPLYPVPAYGSAEFRVALPLYAIGHSGALIIRLREKDGVRSLTLKVPGKRIATAELL